MVKPNKPKGRVRQRRIMGRVVRMMMTSATPEANSRVPTMLGEKAPHSNKPVKTRRTITKKRIGA
jgi:hypothetical protein